MTLRTTTVGLTGAGYILLLLGCTTVELVSDRSGGYSQTSQRLAPT